MRYIIWGWAQVIDANDQLVSDTSILRQLAGFVDEDDLYATDYIGGSADEDAIAEVLLRSGQMRFALDDGKGCLRVFLTFEARRPLTAAELNWLRKYTLGQWSDGMGESLFMTSGPFKDFLIQPLDSADGMPSGYPFVEVVE